LLCILLLLIILAFAGWITAPSYLEKAIIKYIKYNNGSLPIKDVEEYFYSTSKKKSSIVTTKKIINRLKKKNVILIEDNTIKLIV
jgi:hypothetical protein